LHAAIGRRSKSATLAKCQDGFEAALLRAYRQLEGPRDQEVVKAAWLRHLDGQPLEESITEALIEWGNPRTSCAKVREVHEAPASEPSVV
jgi:hypothetical protein